MTLLVTWLWQGLAIVAVTGVALACAPRLSAATRHAIWWVAYAAVVCLPLAHLFIPAVATFDQMPAPASVAVPAPPTTLLPVVLLAWLVFAAVGFGRVALSLRLVLRLKRSGAALAHLPFDRPAQTEIRVSPRITGAAALGLGRPVIVLSRSLVRSLDDQQLASIVMHEQAHLDRHDDWWQLLHGILAALVGWHPAIWILGRRLALEREAACDDRVVAQAHAPLEYARALARAAALRARPRARFEAVVIPGAAVVRSVLWRRVRRLMDVRLDRSTRATVRTRVAVTAAMALIVASAVHVPAMVVFVEVGSLVPGVERAWAPRLLGIATPRAEFSFAAQAVPPAPARSAEALRVQDASPAAESPMVAAGGAVTLEIPGAPRPDAAAGDVPLVPVMPTAHVSTVTAPSPPAATWSSPWSAIGRSTATGAQKIASSGAATGARAADAGTSIGRFFGRAGKRIAAAF